MDDALRIARPGSPFDLLPLEPHEVGATLSHVVRSIKGVCMIVRRADRLDWKQKAKEFSLPSTSRPIFHDRNEGKLHLCPGERFAPLRGRAGQPGLDNVGTGFLVAPNVVATAAHVLPNSINHKNCAFVFGYRTKNDDHDAPWKFDEDQVAFGKNILHRKFDVVLPDGRRDGYCLVELHRRMDKDDFPPLALGGLLFSSVRSLGHPLGMPAKITWNRSGVVFREISDHLMDSDLSTAGGCSGSPVVDLFGNVCGIALGADPQWPYADGTCFRWRKQGRSRTYFLKFQGLEAIIQRLMNEGNWPDK